MPRAIYPTLFKKYPDFGSLSDEERERLLEEERQRYEGEIAAELPGQDPMETLLFTGEISDPTTLPRTGEEPEMRLLDATRKYSTNPFTEQEELPLTAGLGEQEGDPTKPVHLGEFGQADVGEEVPEEQALQWIKEREIYDAPYKTRTALRKIPDYRQKLIDEQFGGVDPNMRDVKKHASSEMSEAKKQFEEILGRPPNTPEERLASFNFQQKAKEQAYKQKQDDVATINDAVSKYSTEEVMPLIKSIQARAAQSQVDLAAQEQAEIEALGKVEAARAKAIEERHKREFPTEKELAAARDRLFAKRIQIEKFKDRPSDDVFKAYNKIARSIGEPEIPIDAIKEAGWGWDKIYNWLKEFWGGEKAKKWGIEKRGIKKKGKESDPLGVR